MPGLEPTAQNGEFYFGTFGEFSIGIDNTDLGANTRFVVTNLDLAGDPQGLYDGLCCEWGEMENRIKDQQLGLFADRASSSDFHANQFRLLLSALAFVLLEGMRRMALNATDLAKASPQTIRLTLLKVGVVVVSNTRRERLLMSRSHPGQALFRRIAASLAPQPPCPPERCPRRVETSMGVGGVAPEARISRPKATSAEPSSFESVRKHDEVAHALESWATRATSGSRAFNSIQISHAIPSKLGARIRLPFAMVFGQRHFGRTLGDGAA